MMAVVMVELSEHESVEMLASDGVAKMDALTVDQLD